MRKDAYRRHSRKPAFTSRVLASSPGLHITIPDTAGAAALFIAGRANAVTDDSDVHPGARSASSTWQNLMSPAFRQNQAIRFWQNFVARSGQLVKGAVNQFVPAALRLDKDSPLTTADLSRILRSLGQITN